MFFLKKIVKFMNSNKLFVSNSNKPFGSEHIANTI